MLDICSCTSLIKYFSCAWCTFTYAPHFTKCIWASSPHTKTIFTAKKNWFQFTWIVYIFTIWWLDTDVSPKATYRSDQCWTYIQLQQNCTHHNPTPFLSMAVHCFQLRWSSVVPIRGKKYHMTTINPEFRHIALSHIPDSES
jgi:hypothetical protein